MVLIVLSVVLFAAGVHYRRAHRIAPGAEPIPGRVVGVSVKRSSISNSNQLLYGVTVEYHDPRTREQAVLPPASHQPRAYQVGDELTLMRDPVSGVVRVPLPRPGLQMALPFVFGVLALGLGVADLAS